MADLLTLSTLVSLLIKIQTFILIAQSIKESTYLNLNTHLRYYLEGRRPSQTHNLITTYTNCYY